ncbi:alpha/beta hydrolase [Pelagicoccus sp. SDUM812002]|uniref:alpha/beta fold hydrolase n=1 Tax=Pelagicoccus sp. SDUM812002 TaxID=3041266 RepID=UPI00281075DE|nr:alpha/beta hydrolase [Pelagicoccus sp. SDUM812002]MDQ8187934.1 alpha/beta hydrolase [Pelagicoccus sp. SDUM812002]
MKKKLILTSILCLAQAAFATPSFEVKVSGSGAPILFIPGLACDGSVWDEAVARYSDSYECHVLSIAGFAGTPPLAVNEPLLDTVKEDLASYIKKESLEKPLIVGHSLGGFIALSLAIDHPEIASQLMVVDSLPFLPAVMNPTATVETTKAQAKAQKEMTSQGSQNEAQLQMMLQTMVTDPRNIDRAHAMSLTSHGPSVAQAMYELNTIDLRDKVSKIQTPTTVLGAWYGYAQFGATQESVANTFRSQYAQHTNYRFVMSERGKHFIMWDDPELFNQELDKILRD